MENGRINKNDSFASNSRQLRWLGVIAFIYQQTYDYASLRKIARLSLTLHMSATVI
jgi:hypothetical protein